MNVELHEQQILPRSTIYVDPVKNARRQYSPTYMAELAANIKKVGLLHPIVVRMISPDHFELVAGYRRLRALDMLGAALVSVTVVDADEARAYDIMLSENTFRNEVAPWDLGAAVLLLVKKNFTFDQIEQRLGAVVDHRSLSMDRMKRLAHTVGFLNSDLYTIWTRGTPEFGEDEAYRVSKLTPDEQFDYLVRLSGGENPRHAIANQGGDRTKKRGKGRPKHRSIELAYQSLKSHDDDRHDDGLSSDERRGARIVLQWILGGRSKCPIKLRPKSKRKEEVTS